MNGPLLPNAIGPYQLCRKAPPFLFVSGQIPLDPATHQVLTDASVVDQTIQALKNLKAVLDSQGLDYSNVVKTTVLLADMKDFDEVNQVYGRFFVEPYPARSTFAVLGLPKGVRVEIEAIAVLETPSK